MTPRKQHKHFYVIVAVVAVTLLTAGWFTYASRRTKLNALQTTLKAKQIEINNLEPEIARRPDLEAEYSRLQERLAVLEPSLPTYAYVPTLLRQLERLGHDTGNKIEAVKPQRARAKDAAKNPQPGTAGGDQEAGEATESVKKPAVPYDSVDINVELQGTYWTTIKFLEQLQKFPKMIAVNEMTLRPSCTATTIASPKLTVQITVKAVVTKRGA